jgi:hypothetical protein
MYSACLVSNFINSSVINNKEKLTPTPLRSRLLLDVVEAIQDSESIASARSDWGPNLVRFDQLLSLE